MNFKKITDVPVLEEILEGDMLVVNHGGTAAQIDASKVGGSGGSMNIAEQALWVGVEEGYVENGNTAYGYVFSNSDMSSSPTCNEGFMTLMNTRVLFVIFGDDVPRILVPNCIYSPDGDNIVSCVCTTTTNDHIILSLMFSDSTMPD